MHISLKPFIHNDYGKVIVRFIRDQSHFTLIADGHGTDEPAAAPRTVPPTNICSLQVLYERGFVTCGSFLVVFALNLIKIILIILFILLPVPSAEYLQLKIRNGCICDDR